MTWIVDKCMEILCSNFPNLVFLVFHDESFPPSSIWRQLPCFLLIKTVFINLLANVLFEFSCYNFNLIRLSSSFDLLYKHVFQSHLILHRSQSKDSSLTFKFSPVICGLSMVAFLLKFLIHHGILI